MNTSRATTYLMLTFAGLIGGGGLLIFMLFLLLGSYNLVGLGMKNYQALIFDAFLCLLFFAQHSLMARGQFRQWVARFLPQKYYGAFYAIASGVVVLVLVVFWQEVPYTVAAVQGFPRIVSRAIFITAIAGVAWTIWALGFFVNFRLQSMVDDLRGRRSLSSLVTDRGPYRWIRHPLYLSSLLMIWSNPDLTLDRLLFNLLFTIWVVVAILLEERGLIMAFGEAYRTYQRSVPMLIPFLINPNNLENESSERSRAS